MNAPEVPDDQSSRGVSIPRWMVLVYWAVGLLPCYAIITITGSLVVENRYLVSGNNNRTKITAQ